MRDWRPGSWRDYPALQQATYPDEEALAAALAKLADLPPLVTSWEILSLREQIAEAQEGKRFVLQGGDCAETFEEVCSPLITNRLKVLLQMSLALIHGLQMPVVRVGRFAGQYAKPRSSDMETRDGVTLPSYRGDLVNDVAFTEEARVPDPDRLLKAHAYSAMTMNFVRSLVDGGFADVHHTEYWDLSWVEHSPLAAEFHEITQSLGKSLRFMETITGRDVGSLRRVDFFTSHEALHLPYEQAQSRQVPRQWGWFNLGTHFPWIGMRTAALDGAHVEPRALQPAAGAWVVRRQDHGVTGAQGVGRHGLRRVDLDAAQAGEQTRIDHRRVEQHDALRHLGHRRLEVQAALHRHRLDAGGHVQRHRPAAGRKGGRRRPPAVSSPGRGRAAGAAGN